MHALKISSLADRDIRSLSGGQQHRFAIARALAVKPKIVLADEPTGNLDEETSNTVTELLFAVAQQNQQTMLIATHSNTLAEKCDRTLGLRAGCIS